MQCTASISLSVNYERCSAMRQFHCLWITKDAVYSVNFTVCEFSTSYHMPMYDFWIFRDKCYIPTNLHPRFYLLTYLIWKKLSAKIVEISAWCRKFCPSKVVSTISIQKSGENRTKLSKFRLGVENFVRRNILSVENFVRRNFIR